MEQTRSGGVSIIRQSILSHQLSEDTTAIIMSSWRPRTNKQYQCYLLQWQTFCNQREIDTIHTSVNYVLEFLTSLYNRDLGYSAINTAKSALSHVVVLSGSGNLPLGQHPLIKRFLRGVFNQRLALPRYQETWNVETVLNYLRSLALEEISLKQLTLKTVMLLALLSGQRVQTLSLLSIDHMTSSQDSVEFEITKLLKQSRPGKHLSCISFCSYPEQNICIVRHVQKYIEITSKLRQSDIFLISFQKPYKPVSTETLSRWIKIVLKASGIDTVKYGAHSTTSAATSAAAANGLQIDVILEKVGWSSAETFAKFYNKPISHSLDKSVITT